MTEEMVDPKVAHLVREMVRIDRIARGMGMETPDVPPQDWLERHRILVLSVALIGLWFAIISGLVALNSH